MSSSFASVAVCFILCNSALRCEPESSESTGFLISSIILLIATSIEESNLVDASIVVNLTNIQEKWIRKFINVWEKAEDYRNRYNDRIEGDQGRMFDLWSTYLYKDKRSFNEYFSEEFGFTCDDSITYKQMKVLCEKLIGRKQ